MASSSGSPSSASSSEHLSRPIAEFLRPGPPPLKTEQTVGEALDSIRASGLEERIFYFYAVDHEGRLSGVVPARRLLTEPLNRHIGEVMMKRVLSLPDRVSLMEACECFILHKFLAIPVVDSEKRLRGIIDVSIFTDEVMELGSGGNNDQIFQTIGIHIQELQHASPLKAFGIRFPWLTVTLMGGGLCALMAEGFSATLKERIVLSVFMALVLGLSEAVSSQALALTNQSLPEGKVRWRWLRVKLTREIKTAFLLGLLSGIIAGGAVALFWHDQRASLAIGLSVVFAVLSAATLGVAIPALLRIVRWDPKISAGPITLATADLITVTIYLLSAKLILG
jgi:magnesium transporter